MPRAAHDFQARLRQMGGQKPPRFDGRETVALAVYQQ